jgi:hypothetical protein
MAGSFGAFAGANASPYLYEPTGGAGAYFPAAAALASRYASPRSRSAFW